MGDHRACSTRKNCGAEDCPAAAAERRREDAERGAWSPLTPPTRDGTEHGSYYHLDGRPIGCGALLELQQQAGEVDDYGMYRRLLQEGLRVRFELQAGKPALHIFVGGHIAFIAYTDWLRFRWPAAGGSR